MRGSASRRFVWTAVAVLALQAGAAARSSEDWLQQTNGVGQVASVSAADLPRVLILGDSISLGYTPFVRSKLAGVADVCRPKCNCGPSQFYLRNDTLAREWLGDGDWDVIHVNFGIWDNHYLKGAEDGMGLYWGKEVDLAGLGPTEAGRAIRAAGFRIRTPIDAYAANLRKILGILKRTGAKVVFGLTTPVPLWNADDRPGRLPAYNEVARRVCAEEGVAVDDLFAVGEANAANLKDGVHYDAKGCDALADAVVASVLPLLPKRDANVCAHGGVDTLNTNLTILVCLDKVERALLCREGDGLKDRAAILRVIGGIDGWRPGDSDELEDAPGWSKAGLAGGDGFLPRLNLAYARLLKLTGALYGFPDYLARGRAVEERLLAKDPSLSFRDESVRPQAVKDYYALMAESRRDLCARIRPGGENGQAFWNGNARLFVYPPSFDFKPVAGATGYRFEVVDDVHRAHVFEAPSPTAALSPVWAELPAGFVTVACRAHDAAGRDIGLAGVRKFWRSASFDPVEYAPARRAFGEAHRKVLDHLFDWPEIAYLESHGRPDIAQGSNFTSYPSKMQSAVIRVMLSVAERFPERRERALRIAHISAEYLLTTREPEGSPLEGFTATYVGAGQLSGKYAGQHMLVYPAEAGEAFLALFAATGGAKWRRAAETIGRTYLRLQGEDGTWYLKMNAADGTPVTPNRLVPTSVMTFLEELYKATGDVAFQRAGDRAFASIDRGPLADWDWEGQFEDIAPSTRRYQNLTKHMPCETALYMLKRFPGDPHRLAQVREILRFAEDQFVMWRTPCRPDGTGPWAPGYQFISWRTPAALEQYSCYSPIDASAAKLIKTYLALYRAEGKPLDLAKARALGASMVNNQDDNGRIRTYWIPEAGDDDPLAGAVRLPLGGDWFNCMCADAEALGLLVGVGNREVAK